MKFSKMTNISYTQTAPNKLDASGGSVFQIIIGPAMVS